jgi:hypothetical protein
MARIIAMKVQTGIFFLDAEDQIEGFIFSCPPEAETIQDRIRRGLYFYRPPGPLPQTEWQRLRQECSDIARARWRVAHEPEPTGNDQLPLAA